jgi:hypothetical protein
MIASLERTTGLLRERREAPPVAGADRPRTGAYDQLKPALFPSSERFLFTVKI